MCAHKAATVDTHAASQQQQQQLRLPEGLTPHPGLQEAEQHYRATPNSPHLLILVHQRDLAHCSAVVISPGGNALHVYRVVLGGPKLLLLKLLLLLGLIHGFLCVCLRKRGVDQAAGELLLFAESLQCERDTGGDYCLCIAPERTLFRNPDAGPLWWGLQFPITTIVAALS